ncbi:hypothetical protein ACT9N5_01750 [Edwardsiella piscicida]|uniref:Uncharacterized protein n=1 Tax=Edwardsiella piscicida TaxID=1263550 RepID=A0AAQ3BXV2_EDWPI|nr:hypothetical protein [Edwardsiella piscicida]MDM3863620.1 hypothetical protein [Edwardsiella piscicida]QHR94426.1 hypothetical protein GT752_03495 [Edwardsiella piscicida]UJT81207.1 hypothetical protein L1P07_09755 [Edwardsiella piscicida]UJT84479.1 hypothetical protein L1P05_09755 [Edwardsiella piscicida]WDU89748.1 hypothetical protein PWJ79_09765 [Edwardsiella piscicida]
MLKKIVPNRRIILDGFNNSCTAPDPGLPPDFLKASGMIYNIQTSVKSGTFFNRQKTSLIAEGPHAKSQSRNFLWLPWVEGAVTYSPISTIDILTGPMSGCWVSVFESHGKRYVAHIGTSLCAELSEQAKASWRAAVNSNTITPLHAFDPFVPIESEFEAFYSIITPHRQIYSVALAYASALDCRERMITRIIPSDNQLMDVTGF